MLFLVYYLLGLVNRDDHLPTLINWFLVLYRTHKGPEFSFLKEYFPVLPIFPSVTVFQVVKGSKKTCRSYSRYSKV